MPPLGFHYLLSLLPHGFPGPIHMERTQNEPKFNLWADRRNHVPSKEISLFGAAKIGFASSLLGGPHYFAPFPSRIILNGYL